MSIGAIVRDTLLLLREIVRRHHGEIHVERAPGAGAAFHIDLPVSGSGPTSKSALT